MKKLLLASTALVGASMLAAPAFAGTPSVKDDFSVSIDGTLRFGVMWWDQDADNNDRGYGFQTDESEVRFRMRGTSGDLAYGFDIELHTQTDDTNNSDETWMFIDGGDAWGRIELGDQDSAVDRIFAGGEDAMDGGRGGWNGDVQDVLVDGGRQADPDLAITSDDTKITYFTPRIAGLQLGASWTPDAGQTGALDEQDNGTDAENVYSLGLNYQNEFNNMTFTITGAYIGGTNESATLHDPEVWGVGINLRYAGFEFGAGYADLNETGVAVASVGADAGQWWDIALNYKTGPWTVGGGYFHSEQDFANTVTTGNTEVDGFSVGFDYAIAAGWKVEGDINFMDVENLDTTGTDNEATILVLATTMSF